MLDPLWNLLIGLPPLIIYALVALLVTLECSAFLGLLIPGETAIILGGFLAYQGKLSLAALIAVAAGAAIVGDTLGYWFGRYKGQRWALRIGRRFGLTPEVFDRAKEFFRRHGGKAVLLGRFTSFARAFIPFTAGTLRLHYPVFLAYNVVGGVIWAVAASLAGYFFGSQWERVAKYVGRGGLVLLILLLVGGWLVWRRQRGKHREA